MRFTISRLVWDVVSADYLEQMVKNLVLLYDHFTLDHLNQPVPTAFPGIIAHSITGSTVRTNDESSSRDLSVKQLSYSISSIRSTKYKFGLHMQSVTNSKTDFYFPINDAFSFVQLNSRISQAKLYGIIHDTYAMITC